MDHMMPDMDGIDAAKHIRAINNDYAQRIPIIALTANAIVGNEEMFLAEGFQAFIAKPIDLSKLDIVLRQWVRNKEEEEKLAHKMITIEIRRGKEKRVLRDIQGLDVGKGIAHFGHSENAYGKVLQSFVNNTRPLLDILKAFTRENLGAYGVTVHGIKGSAYGIFAKETGDFAAALEKASLTGDHAFISENNPVFIDMLTSLLAGINETLAESGLADKPMKDHPDPALLWDLLDACARFDIDGMDEAMNALESFAYTHDGGLVESVRKNMDQGKYKHITSELTEAIKRTEA
jgi:hypothetical protein